MQRLPQRRLAAQTRISTAHRKHKHVLLRFIPTADGSRDCHQATHAHGKALLLTSRLSYYFLNEKLHLHSALGYAGCVGGPACHPLRPHTDFVTSSARLRFVVRKQPWSSRRRKEESKQAQAGGTQTWSTQRAPSSSSHPGRDRELHPALQKAKGKAPSCLLRHGGRSSEMQQGVNRTLSWHSQNTEHRQIRPLLSPREWSPAAASKQRRRGVGIRGSAKAWTCLGGLLPQPGALATSLGSLSPQHRPIWTQGQGRPPPDGHCSRTQLMSSVLSWKVTVQRLNLRNRNR